MKVVDILKHKSESLARRHQFEFRELMSPVLREYWSDIVSRAHAQHIFPWIKDHNMPAVNEESPRPTKPLFELSEEGRELYKELKPKIGEELHIGDWLSIDQERINAFGLVTEDMQWIHTDPERALLESPFKTPIAHGFLTLSMLSKLTDSVDPDRPPFPSAKMTVNIGLNRVRFPYPVRAGNRIRSRSKLLKVTPVTKGIEIEREIKVEIEGIRRPACLVVSVVRLII